ncbi:MAG: 7-cyano-7-deazaguanine synthase QueC [Calothrix sp. SM1_7_51]|nr:7-cyano-7-deazaguanine synthase QueC [Calothrix sp. SM1_7_51]
MTALLIYSGGMDSTVLLYEQRDNIKLCVSFNYGSKHNDREYEFAKRNTARLGIEHLQLDIKDIIGKHFKSDLLQSGGDIPDGHYEDTTMQRTVVPFRNGIMLAFAVGLAESRGLNTVLIANHSGDHAIYPDCRLDFIQAMSKAAGFGTYNQTQISGPYTHISKRDIALRGRDLGVSFADTWSCYKGGEIHCGSCGTCFERREALSGFDPTQYLATPHFEKPAM